MTRFSDEEKSIISMYNTADRVGLIVKIKEAIPYIEDADLKNTAADIVSKLVHGEEEATKAQEGARALFSSGNAADMPTAELSDEDFADGSVDILTLLHKSGLVASKSEARRAVQQGGVAVDGEKVSDIATTFAKADFEGEGKVVRKGKKNFRKVIAK